MSEEWLYQLRIYLDDDLAQLARTDSRAPQLRPLAHILDRHDATLVNQFQAFEDYVAEAERQGTETYPLYKWTKATVEDPAMRMKHGRTFSLHVGGSEVYPRETADALEREVKPLVGGDLVRSMSRHDTNPANNIPVPPRYR